MHLPGILHRKDIGKYLNRQITIKYRENLERLEGDRAFRNIIAWSTSNTVVRVSNRGQEQANNLTVLCEVVREHERMKIESEDN
jgi:hypothetical protein